MNDDTSRSGSRARSKNGSNTPSFLDDSDTAQLAELLIDSFPPVEPDPGVWDRIEAQIASSETSESSTGPATTWQARRLAPLMAIAAVFVIVAASAFIVSQRSSDTVTVASGEVVRSLEDPISGEVTMRVVSREDGTSLAINDGLPALGPDQTYQLWSVVGDEIVSVGLLGSDPGDVAIRVEGQPAVLALTVEASGGVAVSQAEPVAVWANG